MDMFNKSNQKLWIIGDSFASVHNRDECWPWLLFKSFIGDRVILLSKGSRDIQSIIDIFLRYINEINKEDVVIFMLPTMARYRSPLKHPKSINIYGNLENEDMLKNISCYHAELSKIDYFTGYNIEDDLGFLTQSLKDFLNENNEKWDLLNRSLMSAESNIQNTNEILKSFVKYFPFKIILCSWSDDLDSSIVLTKEKIKNGIGEWHTMHDEWEETLGKYGNLSDFHWSKKMEKLFAEYIIKSYPEYFTMKDL